MYRAHRDPEPAPPANRTRLKAKMFGGGRNISGVTDAAAKTIAFVRQFLRQHGPLVEEKLGDSHPRRVMYFPSSGTALVKRLPPRYAASVANREMQYFNRLVREPMSLVREATPQGCGTFQA
jgi:chemotaxis protein CheD